MTNLLSEIISLLTSGITDFASGLGSGLTALVEGIFVTANTVEGVTTYNLTTFGGLCIIFMGISLVIGLSRFVMNWVTSLGN